MTDDAVLEHLSVSNPGPERAGDHRTNRGDRVEPWAQLARLVLLAQRGIERGDLGTEHLDLSYKDHQDCACRHGQRASAEIELAKIKKRQRQIVDAIADGISARTLKDELMALEAREDVLMAKLQTTPQQNVRLNPNMAEIYRQRVAVLHQALEAPDGNVEAIEAVRSLIDRIAVTPTAGKLTIDLYGEIAAILCMAAGKKVPTFPFRSPSN